MMMMMMMMMIMMIMTFLLSKFYNQQSLSISSIKMRYLLVISLVIGCFICHYIISKKV